METDRDLADRFDHIKNLLGFMLAGLLVGVPLWILMSYGITADGRPSSPKILIGMSFCFVVGVFWLYEDLKDLLRTR